MKFNKKTSSVFSSALLIVFVYNMFFTTVAFALTTKDSQPDYYGYQPVDATDNVSLTTGKFNYTIPITSIPEFPMAIGYGSGFGMDHEAGAFGFGFSGFSGAITRSALGIPDDVTGNKQYHYQNQKRWDASVEGAYNFNILEALQVPPPTYGGFSGSVKVGYDNYKGAYGAIGIGMFAGLKAKNLPGGIGLGAGLVSDSRVQGISYGAGLGISIGIGIKKIGTGQSLLGVGVGGTMGPQKRSATASVSSPFLIGKSVFPATPPNNSSSLPGLSYVIPNSSSMGATLPVSYGSFSFTGSYNQYKVGQEVINKKVFGFLHLGSYQRRDRDHLADFTIDGENSFSENPADLNNPSFLQKDYYSINTMGLSGAMQPYQKSYGVVSRSYSREQHRDYSLANIKTNRREVDPWVKVAQTKLNKGIDILALIKKKDQPDDKDFDKTIFDEYENVSLTTLEHSFRNTAEFKMRGDMAGEYNLGSSDFTDGNPNNFDFQRIQGVGDKEEFKFARAEKETPLYFPRADYKARKGFSIADSKFEKGTDIKITPIAAMVGRLRNKVPSVFASGITECIYYQYNRLNPVNKPKSYNYNLNNSRESFNLISHLSNMIALHKNLTIAIGEIEVRNTSGLKYYFGLPVFAHSNKTVRLQGKGEQPPQVDGDDYVSFHENSNKRYRQKVTETEQYAYPYAWLLTAIVGDDYIDLDNIPGPSEGDVGYWVKFKYIKVADNYRWRNPFTGMTHIPNRLHDPADDVYMVSSGKKEIYYLSEIESNNYICRYDYEKRYDGLDAATFANGAAFNTMSSIEPISSTDRTGDNFQFLVKRIDLFKKHDSGDNSKTRTNVDPFGTPIKSTKFYYDYSTSSHVRNNFSLYVGVTAAEVSYHINEAESPSSPIGTGKATLRKVQHIAYDENGTEFPLPSYQFSYWGDYNSIYNPAYDADQVDQWGNYCASSKYTSSGVTSANYYSHYTEVLKQEADKNSKVFNLKKINLPSGGSLEVDYEAQSYATVETKTPWIMRKILDINMSGSSSEYSNLNVTMDVSDLASPDNTTNPGLYGSGSITAQELLFGEIAFYRSPKTPNSKDLYMCVGTGKAGTATVASKDPATGKWTQTITLQANGAFGTPFIHDLQTYMYSESTESRILRETYNCTNANELIVRYQNIEQDNALDAARKVVANIRAVFTSDNNFHSKFNTCFGTPGIPYGTNDEFISDLSFIRTKAVKAKYTGSVVKSIVMKDGFSYATAASGSGTTTDENKYETEYFYDENGDGTGTSAGVATLEIGGGPTCVIDQKELIGSGFYPSPTIISGKTTVQNGYEADESTGAYNPSDAVSRKKGKTVYEFFTPKNYTYKTWFQQTLAKNEPGSAKGNVFMFGVWTFFKIKVKFLKLTIKVPFWVPLSLKWNRHDKYHMKSYSYTDVTDIYGRLKEVKQLTSNGDLVGKQTYEYYGSHDGIQVYKDNFNTPIESRPGKMDQVWSEAFYTKQSKINFIPWLLTLDAKTDRNFVYTNMKYSYVPPVIKKVTSTVDGLTTVAENIGFDYFTGTPIDVRSNDSYNNTKIVRTVPAYWHYPEMGSSYANPQHINNLTATTATYMYLNGTNNSDLIGASVVKWTSNTSKTWKFDDYLITSKTYSDPTTWKYEYYPTSGSDLISKYDYHAQTDQTIKRNYYIFKPYEGYTYEVPLNANGTFKSFNSFSYSSPTQAAGWKKISENQIYSFNGVLLQSKDALDKYASQHMGYNYSNTIGAVSNSGYNNSVFEGAENTYAQGSNIYLENNKVRLGDAEVFKPCKATFLEKTLSISTFPSAGGYLKKAHILNIQPPVNVIRNVPFAKLNVTYKHNTALKRIFYIQMNDNNEYEIMSNFGETFQGFFTLKGNGTTRLLFNPDDFNSIALDYANINMNGFITSLQLNYEYNPYCTLETKKYWIPENDCVGDVHTGSYAFKLREGKTGTLFIFSPLNVRQNEFKRKYKALVWIHGASTPNSELVMQKRDVNGNVIGTELVASNLSPYAVAGNWRQLRLDFDLTTSSYSPDATTAEYITIFVRNKSESGVTIYDDLRVLPYHADMTNWVFDHKFNRVTSGLDNDNFASYSAYDPRGRVVESSVEIQNVGKNTVQKFLYNDQKRN